MDANFLLSFQGLRILSRGSGVPLFAIAGCSDNTWLDRAKRARFEHSKKKKPRLMGISRSGGIKH